MLASCAYWKGLNLRDPKWKLDGINTWLKAFEKREYYLAFKSDYYTHVKDIPPQYGPGCNGGFEKDQKAFSSSILGKVRSYIIVPIVYYLMDPKSTHPRLYSRTVLGIYLFHTTIRCNHFIMDHPCPFAYWSQQGSSPTQMEPIKTQILSPWPRLVASWRPGSWPGTA